MPAPEPHPEPAAAPTEVAAARPEAAPEPAPVPDVAPDTAPPAAAAVAAAAGAAPTSRRSLDDNLMSILREEAAREAAERRAEAERSMQVQPDLGLPDSQRRPASRPVENSFADLSEPDRNAAPDHEPETPRTRPPSRRTLLPDIEEINSTLRPGTDERGGEDVPAFRAAAERRKGFGAGFISVLVLAVLLALVYAFAPRLSEMVPQASSALDAYVAAVDAARLWLDAALKQATGALQGLTAEEQAPQG